MIPTFDHYHLVHGRRNVCDRKNCPVQPRSTHHKDHSRMHASDAYPAGCVTAAFWVTCCPTAECLAPATRQLIRQLYLQQQPFVAETSGRCCRELDHSISTAGACQSAPCLVSSGLLVDQRSQAKQVLSISSYAAGSTAARSASGKQQFCYKENKKSPAKLAYAGAYTFIVPFLHRSTACCETASCIEPPSLREKATYQGNFLI